MVSILLWGSIVSAAEKPVACKGTMLYLGGFELPNRNAAAHRVVANAKLLRDLGYEVILIGARPADGLGLVRYSEDYFGFSCWSVPQPEGVSGWMKRMTGVPELLDFIARQTQLSGVICYNYPAIAQMRVYWACKRLGVRRVADTTEWYDGTSKSPLFRLVKKLDTELRIRWVNKFSDGLITTGWMVTNYYDGSSVPVVEVPTLFDRNDFAPRVPVSTGRRSFVYFGYPFDQNTVNKSRTNMKDRLDLCVQAFFELSTAGYEFDFDIYGMGLDEYVNVLPEHGAWIDSMSGMIRFHGRVSHATVKERIADADFSIFFRDSNKVTLSGFPTKLSESISYGTPVITSRTRNLQAYEKFTGIILAERGEERNVIERAMNLGEPEVIELKRACGTSAIFDYRSFKAPVENFLAEMGLS